MASEPGFGTAREDGAAFTSEVARVVASGLFAERKSLPAWLLYDARGSALYSQITHLPEYYLTRAEAEIFSFQADAIVARLTASNRRIALVELGAGAATKTEALLTAVVRAQGTCTYLGCDIAAEPLRLAKQRIEARLPSVSMRMVVGTHLDAGPSLSRVADRQVLMFIGSSIGNYADDDAVALLSKMRSHLRDDAMLLLGADLRKDPAVMLAAYDDAQGVTAAFSLNLLRRLNRELRATFDLSAFRHVATWDAAASNIEIYLESTRAQRVMVGALGREVRFAAGERIHTETSAKYDDKRVERILVAAGFDRVATHLDSGGRYALHLACARGSRAGSSSAAV